jgi:hypothetical protein
MILLKNCRVGVIQQSLIGNAKNTNFIVHVLIRMGHEPTIYRTRSKHANHYTTDAVIHVCHVAYDIEIDH